MAIHGCPSHPCPTCHGQAPRVVADVVVTPIPPLRRFGCAELMKSKVIPGHIHTCTGDHEGGLHKCSDPDCRRWFGERP